MTAFLVRGVKTFGKFWWDFLVGDTPELALATGVIVALAFLIDGERLVGATRGFTYSASVPMGRPVADYTPRIVASHVGAIVPLEAAFILWHDAPSWR